MSVNILTPGHIKCLEWLSEKYPESQIIIGLLTSEALKGYKKEVVPYEDRKFIVETLIKGMWGLSVVGQKTLDPSENIKKLKPTHIASGDGWERSEIEAIDKFELKRIDIKFTGEKEKVYSSTKIFELTNHFEPHQY